MWRGAFLPWINKKGRKTSRAPVNEQSSSLFQNNERGGEPSEIPQKKEGSWRKGGREWRTCRKKSCRRFVTAGDLVVINHRERERPVQRQRKGKREREEERELWVRAAWGCWRSRKQGSGARWPECVCVCQSVCVCVFVDSGGERHDSDCLVSVPEVRFSDSESRTALNTLWPTGLLTDLITVLLTGSLTGVVTDWFPDWITRYL